MNKTRVTLPGPTLDEKEKTLRIEVFWETLERYSIEDIELALSRAREELNFFPTPFEIIKFIDQEGHKRYLQNRKVEEERKEIDWMEPTEEGKRKAKELIDELFSRWIIEDNQITKDREDRFQKRKLELKKQAKLLLRKN